LIKTIASEYFHTLFSFCTNLSAEPRIEYFARIDQSSLTLSRTKHQFISKSVALTLDTD